MYDVSHNFSPTNIHNYDTKFSSSENYYIKYSRLNNQKNSFSRFGVRLWNQIPAHIRNLSKKAFNKAIKSSLLENLLVNGYYSEISKLFQ